MKRPEPPPKMKGRLNFDFKIAHSYRLQFGIQNAPIPPRHSPPRKQVFSEHEQAPTPPKSFSSISEVSMTTSGRVFLTEMVKRHIYGLGPFI